MMTDDEILEMVSPHLDRLLGPCKDDVCYCTHRYSEHPMAGACKWQDGGSDGMKYCACRRFEQLEAP